MPKTAKLRRAKASNSIHSRAAKRVSSPSLEVDKSLLNLAVPEDPKTAPLTAKQKLDKAISEISMRTPGQGLSGEYAGVSKKKRGTKLTSKQRRRKEQGVIMAERVAGRLEKKVEESTGRCKTVEGRKGNWEELNSKIEVPVNAAADMVVEMKMMK
ncbi:hypothetical protein L211DRAFT_864396 [Terfezia boudieri ATCC MYA-4762]|uniref:Ribosome biogenesis protein SLX9 n=1 Tax=Terfezia boudieri ATCC MYA-4762 TaxID=1051890 RepID=A0A3N4M3Y3_9PEZI|nr:hypothetical protein L211DRAFT_864396 [Terfezia boudieri ATCC MYA-4762]